MLVFSRFFCKTFFTILVAKTCKLAETREQAVERRHGYTDNYLPPHRIFSVTVFPRDAV